MLAATPDWAILGWSFLISTGIALGIALTIIAGVLRRDAADNARVGLGTQLPGLGGDWSFKDNWVGSVTIGSGLLVGLLAASNVLQAVLGATPEAALGLIAVGGAVAAVVAGMSPVVVKLFGPNLNVPTVGGMLAAAAVTVVGTVGQIVTMTWQVASLASNWMSWLLVAVGCLTGAIVVVYALRALSFYIRTGVTAPPSGTSPPGRNALL